MSAGATPADHLEPDSSHAPRIVLTSARSSQDSEYQFAHEDEDDSARRSDEDGGDGEASPASMSLAKPRPIKGISSDSARASIIRRQDSSSPASGQDDAMDADGDAGSGGGRGRRRQSGRRASGGAVDDDDDDDGVQEYSLNYPDYGFGYQSDGLSDGTSASQRQLNMELGLASRSDTSPSPQPAGHKAHVATIEQRLTTGHAGGWWSRRMKKKQQQQKEEADAAEQNEGGEQDAQGPKKPSKAMSMFRSKIRAVAFAASKKPSQKTQLSKVKKYASIHDFVSEDGESRAGIDAAILQELNDIEASHASDDNNVFGLSHNGSRRSSAVSTSSAAAHTSRSTSPASHSKGSGAAAHVAASAGAAAGKDKAAAGAGGAKEHGGAGAGAGDGKATMATWAKRLLVVFVLLVAAAAAVLGGVLYFAPDLLGNAEAGTPSFASVFWSLPAAVVDMSTLRAVVDFSPALHVAEQMHRLAGHFPFWIPRAH